MQCIQPISMSSNNPSTFHMKENVSLAFDALDLSSLWYCRREEGNLEEIFNNVLNYI